MPRTRVIVRSGRSTRTERRADIPPLVAPVSVSQPTCQVWWGRGVSSSCACGTLAPLAPHAPLAPLAPLAPRSGGAAAWRRGTAGHRERGGPGAPRPPQSRASSTYSTGRSCGDLSSPPLSPARSDAHAIGHCRGAPRVHWAATHLERHLDGEQDAKDILGVHEDGVNLRVAVAASIRTPAEHT